MIVINGNGMEKLGFKDAMLGMSMHWMGVNRDRRNG